MKGPLNLGPPEPIRHVWLWYCDLAAARTGTGYGLNPIGFAEIDAWARLMRVSPTPWEVSLLRRIDCEILPKILNRPVEPEGVAVSDIKGVSALFKGLKSRASAKFGGK